MRPDSPLARCLSISLTLLLTIPPGTAFAGADQAREFFREAKQAYSRGDYERAAKLLNKAYTEEANLTYQYNRVRALEGAGNYAKALEVLKTYEKPMLAAKGFEDVPKLKASLQKKVEKDPAKSDTSTADSLREDPEKDSQDDSQTDESQRDASSTTAGTDTTEEVEVSTSQSNQQSMRMVGWGLTGVGAAALTVGALYGSMAMLPGSIRTRVQNDQGLTESQRATFNNHRTMAVVFLGAGAATAIGGSVLLLSQTGSEADQTVTASRLQPTVTPFVSREGGGAVLNLQF